MERKRLVVFALHGIQVSRDATASAHDTPFDFGFSTDVQTFHARRRFLFNVARIRRVLIGNFYVHSLGIYCTLMVLFGAVGRKPSHRHIEIQTD